MSAARATPGCPERAGTRPDAGYSLVSVLIALVLLSVGVLSLTGVLTQSVRLQTISEVRTTALSIAQTYMEDIRARDPLTLTAEAETEVDDQGVPVTGGRFTREVTLQSAGRNLMEVVVIVRTPRSEPVRLVTWIYDGDY